MLNSKLRFTILLVSSIWIVFIINLLVPIKLGVHPRELSLMSGVGLFLNPFFHDNFAHIIGNTMPLAVLSFIYALRFKNEGAIILMTMMLIFFGSLGVWMFGEHANHIGASGLIFAYFGYIVGSVFTKSSLMAKLRDLLLASVAMVLYGVILFSLFSITPEISWSGHICGFVAGVVLSRFHYVLDSNNTQSISV